MEEVVFRKDRLTATATVVGRFSFAYDAWGASTRTAQHLGDVPAPATAVRPLRASRRHWERLQ
jgi:hypothetical protein